MTICYKNDYYGVPEEHLPAIEAAAQATLDEYFALALAVHADKEVDVWNCSVYRSKGKTAHGKDYTRIRIVNHSSGYWAVMEWSYPHEDLEDYKGFTEFRVFAACSDVVKVGTKVDWREFQTHWGYSRADLFWKAIKNPKDTVPEERTWHAPTHALSFKHPLLMTLRLAVYPPD